MAPTLGSIPAHLHLRAGVFVARLAEFHRRAGFVDLSIECAIHQGEVWDWFGVSMFQFF